MEKMDQLKTFLVEALEAMYRGSPSNPKRGSTPLTPYGITEQLHQVWINQDDRLETTTDNLMRYIQLRLQEPTEFTMLSEFDKKTLVEKTLKEIL